MDKEDNPIKAAAEEPNFQTQSQQGSASLRGRSVTFDPSIQNKNEDMMSRILITTSGSLHWKTFLICPCNFQKLLMR
jgi:hypothetical protein